MAERTRSKLPFVLVGAVLLLVALLLAPWLLRHTIATSMARSELEARGLSCDDRLEVEVASAFGSATVGPTRCTRSAGGLIEAYELLGPAHVELSAMSPTSIRFDSVRIVLGDHDVRNGSDWASQLRQLRMEQRMASLLKGLSELSELDLPPSTIVSAELVRGGSRVAQARQLTMTDEGETVRLTAEGISSSASVAELDLTQIEGTLSASSVHLEGRASARVGVPIFGGLSVSRTGPFSVDATGLDTASPRFDLDADL